ncbi:type I methionyl aminopeptidase [Kiritimatiella glycovorans]|uniref:Methionine aminopeptidase n=1 Tax=Kiritimatiella glycovorans TaxID=1307763 RepID=A0A0G3EEN6_9BACT|nr:type I methionyl aminopeptidase [Kiritimatiella glycovorans]AKJ64936.1 Methionine aminopeptidase 1 [Kiritimatiella glycovorans]
MIPVKSPAELDAMRRSCRATAGVLEAVAGRVAPGVTTRELDELAREMIRDTGGTAAFYGYRGYPAHLCVSINEEVVHGIPAARRINPGDIVSIDIGIVLDGFVGDCATTVAVGVEDPDVRRLCRTTREALKAGVARAVEGNRLSDISHAVQSRAEEEGFSIVRQFVGHGIGREMHEEPQIPNFGPPGKGPRLKAGMTLAIEPMVNMGGSAVQVLEDDWTVVTRDRRPSAHYEYTVAVGRDEPEILTPVPDF